jgi:hypothetical protein
MTAEPMWGASSRCVWPARRASVSGRRGGRKGRKMLDVLCIALTVLFFTVNVAFAVGCDRLTGGTTR